jgi:hypothetical protein
MYPGVRFFLLALVGFFVAPASMAGTASLSWDNDLFADRDRGYTNGLKVAVLGRSAERHQQCRFCLARRVRDLGSALPGVGDADRQHALSFSLRQLMTTPENIEAERPDFATSTPYMGYLNARAGLWSWNQGRITGYSVMVGIVGPESRAQDSQELVHDLTGSTQPRGWDYQLGTDVVGGVEIVHARRFFAAGASGEREHDLSWFGSARGGNFMTNVRFGLAWRTGVHLPVNFVPDYTGISSSVGLPGALDAAGRGWMLFAGIQAEWIPWFYLEEESGPYDYKQRSLVGHAGGGVGWHTPGFQVTLTLRASTAQTRIRDRSLSFGNIALTWGF